MTLIVPEYVLKQRQAKEKAEKIFKKLNKSNFITIAQELANLTEDDIDLGWNTRSEMPEEIVENVFKNDSVLKLDSSFHFNSGDWVKIIENDRSLVTSNWALNSVGQIAFGDGYCISIRRGHHKEI